MKSLKSIWLAVIIIGMFMFGCVAVIPVKTVEELLSLPPEKKQSIVLPGGFSFIVEEGRYTIRNWGWEDRYKTSSFKVVSEKEMFEGFEKVYCEGYPFSRRC